MKLVIFGLTISSSWGNGHATLWRGLCGALGRMGHDVEFFERDVPYYASHRDRPDPEGCALHLYSGWEESRVERTLEGADAAMVTSYCPDARAASEVILRSRVPMRCFYDLDTPITLDRLRRGEDVEYFSRELFPEFDLVLSFTAGRALTALQRELGARKVAPLYGSVDPDLHRPCPPSREYESDLSYLGTYAADRQPTLDELFFRTAHRLENRRFLLGGSLYPREMRWPPNVRHLEHVPPGEHRTFFGSSRLTLNVTRAAMAEWGYCPSGRLFEAAACGVPMVSDDWEGLDEFFERDTEILVARRADDVVRALSLPDGDLAEVAARAKERTLDEHTASCRAIELVRLLAQNEHAH